MGPFLVWLLSNAFAKEAKPGFPIFSYGHGSYCLAKGAIIECPPPKRRISILSSLCSTRNFILDMVFIEVVKSTSNENFLYSSVTDFFQNIGQRISVLQVIEHLQSNPILSYPILSYPILSYPILSYPILSYPILSYPILSYPILSYPILSYPILSYPILSYPILSYPILSYPILSYPILILSYPTQSNPILHHSPARPTCYLFCLQFWHTVTQPLNNTLPFLSWRPLQISSWSYTYTYLHTY